MRLIADSGGTKTDWAIISPEGTISYLDSKGLQPTYMSSEEMLSILQNLNVYTTKVTQVHFYAAGCGIQERKEKLERLLMQHFTNAEIVVEHDVLGACRALLGKGSGLAGIMGTGVNTCWYEEGEIKRLRLSLGHYIGDEGSGSYIGKNALKMVLEGGWSQQLHDAVLDFAGVETDAQLIHKLYQQQPINVYCASFAGFLHAHRHHKEVKELLHMCFTDFALFHLNCYASEHREVALVGSIAWYFKDEVELALKEQGFTLTDVKQKPLEALVEYHLLND